MTSGKELFVETQIIKRNDPRFQELDDLCFKAKNLYNAALYEKRQHYFKTKQWVSWQTLGIQFANTNQVDYRALPAKVSKYVLKGLDDNFKAFFTLLKMKQKGAYTKKVRLPKYKDKVKGRYVLHYHKQALSFKEEGFVKLSKSELKFQTKVPKDRVQYLKVVHCGHHIKVQIAYYGEVKPLKYDPKKKFKGERITSIDIGLNNLMTITSTEFNPCIINGKPLKSVNNFYNKVASRKKSILMKRNKTYGSKSLDSLLLWREMQINDYVHKATTAVVNLMKTYDIDTVIIGRNKGWKDNIKIGKRNNQNFVSVPFMKVYDQLAYKLRREGIVYIETEESHTSKCSFLDKEEIRHHKKYAGRRKHRGLFVSKNGEEINADVNGSLNIMRKYLTGISCYDNNLHNKLLSKMKDPKRYLVGRSLESKLV